MEFKRNSYLVALGALVLFTTGCVMRPVGSSTLAQNPIVASYASGSGQPVVPVLPGFGFIVTDYKAPILTMASDKLMSASKVGKAKTKYISLLWYPILGGWGDASVEAAAKSAGITKVEHVEYELFSVLGTYGELTVTVYGD